MSEHSQKPGAGAAPERAVAPAALSAGQSAGWQRGYQVRTQVLGKAFVDRALEGADDLTRDLQNYMTEHAWGAIWARPGLDLATRSMLNLAMLTALNRPQELGIHLRGALRNGVTRAQIKEILLQTAVYCGAPAAQESFRVARRVFEEIDAEEKAAPKG